MSFLINSILSDFPVIEATHPRVERELPDILDEIGLPNKKNHDLDLRLDPVKIDKLLLEFSLCSIDNRQAHAQRLAYIFEFGLMNSSQKEKYAEYLWREVDENGFPLDIEFFKAAFLELPIPNSIDAKKLLYTYFTDSKFPILGNTKSYPMSGGRCQICSEFLRARQHLTDIAWAAQDAQKLFKKIELWWDTDKIILSEATQVGFVDRQEDLILKFYRATQVLSAAVAPFMVSPTHNEDILALLSMVKEMRFYQISTAELEAEIILRKLSLADLLLKNITFDILSENSERATKGIIAATKLLEGKVLKDENLLLQIIVDVIKYRKVSGLVAALKNFEWLLENRRDLCQPFIEEILWGLEIILRETKIEAKNNMSIADKLHVREASAELAYKLVKDMNMNGNKIPATLSDWEKVCQSDVEFSEIKNVWSDIK